jgi:hypothetical protein
VEVQRKNEEGGKRVEKGKRRSARRTGLSQTGNRVNREEVVGREVSPRPPSFTAASIPIIPFG